LKSHKQNYSVYSSEINQEEPIASSHVTLLLLSFIDTVKWIYI